MKKKIFILIVFILLMQCVFAYEIISRTIYSNGTVVLMCKNGNNVDYCTLQDEQNEITVLRNPNITIIEKTIFKQPARKKNFREKCYNIQQNIGSGANIINTFADTTRMITSFMGIT